MVVQIYIMGKVLRFILILISILIVGFLVLCAVTDSEVNMERRTTINAPKAVVWEQIVNFKNWEHWNAWKEQDTTIVVDYSGNDGQVGSKYHYVGQHSGEGTCTNVGLTDGEMKYEMDFVKPFPGKADGYYKVAEEGGKVTVIVTYHQKMGFLMRGMFAVMGKGMLEKMFDRGLELLKNYSEAHAADMPAMAGDVKIEEIQYAAHIYAGIKGKVAVADEAGMHKFFSDAYSMLGKEAGPRIAGPSVGIINNWDDATMSGEMTAAFPVKDNKPVKGAEIIEMPAGSGYQVKYMGPYGAGMMDAHQALKKATAGKNVTLKMEEYVKTPGDTPDSTKWETNIIYLVK